jgi:hypothetical protein
MAERLQNVTECYVGYTVSYNLQICHQNNGTLSMKGINIIGKKAKQDGIIYLGIRGKINYAL